MPRLRKNFTGGRMEKALDDRLVQESMYTEALNIRVISNAGSDVGVVTNVKGNVQLSTLRYIDGTPLSAAAVATKAYADSSNERIIWFVHDPNFSVGDTGKLDLIVSMNLTQNMLTYHVVSIDDGGGVNTTLNFNPEYLVRGANLVNELFYFTDFYNPPRKINLTRNYPTPVGNIDQFTEYSILVVKQPPVESPSFVLAKTGTEDTFLNDRFVCFAYRYRYPDNEYSAVSQFSQPAFYPKPFEFAMDTYLNAGMKNFYNTAIITYNSGDPLVEGIDILFKEAGSNVIKIVERLDKKKMGLADNTDYTYSFTDSKIFTILPDYEILRLYDNVPLLAKAQTVMGNRLVYGAYVEGGDLEDASGASIHLDYEATLVSVPIEEVSIGNTLASSGYTIDVFLSIPNSKVYINLANVEGKLKEGNTLSISILFDHHSWSGSGVPPVSVTQDVGLYFVFYLIRDYTSVYDFASSQEFLDAVGTTNIQTVPDACSGVTFTDQFNCQIPASLGGYEKYESGISGGGQPIGVIASPASKQIGLQLPAMHFVNDIDPLNIMHCYEYYTIKGSSSILSENSSRRSLHSNRGYEVGIIYMDDFLRSSTALVSKNNTVNVPCSACGSQNSIRITIPASQKAPYWAKRYKFVLKADKQFYETIYSNIFFRDPDTNATYFLLQGDNAQKVEAGDKLVVKADTGGIIERCTYATVLEKESKMENFIDVPASSASTNLLYVPSGVYMKINAINFLTEKSELSVIDFGTRSNIAYNGGEAPGLQYPVQIYDQSASPQHKDIEMKGGSVVKFIYRMERKGTGDGNNTCEKRIFIFEKAFVVSKNYASFKDWFDGDNIGAAIDVYGDGTGVGGNGCPITNNYDPTVLTSFPPSLYNLCINQWRFVQASPSSPMYLMTSGTITCPSIASLSGQALKKERSSISGRIIIVMAGDTMVFETSPSDALPDLFFENEESFAIDSNGNHLGNTQDQNIQLGDPAIIDSSFFNCFAFGNGVESYKVEDAMDGKPFYLGNRVTSTAEQEYKRVYRPANTTWSGNYNDETNVNKLNSFNLGLVNYQRLEESFGDIEVLDGRETDMLVLQEDRISYVLVGKNLLSDAAAGGTITSIPEVFGTQIARVEEFGISHNPESYVRYGGVRFFTDAKRGVVVRLSGNSQGADQLEIVSAVGLEMWFKDLFSESLYTQKIGGFDPYFEEYCLSANDNALPMGDQQLPCGRVFTMLLSTDPLMHELYLGETVGMVTVTYNIISVDTTITITAIYNEIEYSATQVSTSGSIVFNKNTIGISTLTLIALATSGVAQVEIMVSCPDASILTVVLVCVTSYEDRDKLIHNEYRYVDGVSISPVMSSSIQFSNAPTQPCISQYAPATGLKGQGGFPTDGSTVLLWAQKLSGDNFDFDALVHRFRYLGSNTLYGNSISDVLSLISSSTNIIPLILGNTGVYYGQFIAPNSKNYLYLIWDYRRRTPIILCYLAEFDMEKLCTLCGEGGGAPNDDYFIDGSTFLNATSVYMDVDLEVIGDDGYYSNGTHIRQQVDGMLLPAVSCPET